MFWRRFSSGPIGLLAGSGELPVLFAEAARDLKKKVVVFGIEGYTDKRVEAFAEAAYYMPHLGALDELSDRLRKGGIRKVVLAGSLPKKEMHDPTAKLDGDLKDLLVRPAEKGDDSLLRAFQAYLKFRCGVSILDSRAYLKEILAGKGVMTRRAPLPEEWKDLRYGFKIAQGIGRMDIGQTVVVKNGVVLAIEAIEGTDEAIRRGGGLLGQAGAVVVKTAKPHQSLRFDLPCVGPETLKSLLAAKSRALGVEAGKTLILSKKEFLQKADHEGIAVVGL